MTATTFTRTRPTRPPRTAVHDQRSLHPKGLAWCFASEGFASVLGFVALVYQARTLSVASFAKLEYAAAVAAWLLVLVRGGIDVIVYREAARRPRLIGPLTDLLIGLRLIAAVVGYAFVLAIAASVEPERGKSVALAGLLLFVSAWVADVGPRATGRLGWVALAQASRALGFFAAVFVLVRGLADSLAAAACLLIGEALAAGVPLALHTVEHGFPRPRWRRRAALVLARRGGVAALTRFARVTLYGADLLALGWASGNDLGPYAAARRLVFALVALGLVVPSALGPALGKAWAAGSHAGRERLGIIGFWIWSLSLPAAVGLGMTADRWMLTLFGEPYERGGPTLALIAARLPWLLAASTAQTALIACRREGWALRLVLGQSVVAAFLIPSLLAANGSRGVAEAAVIVELTGALAGWAMLARLGVATSWTEQTGRAVVGCFGLIAGCRISSTCPLPVMTFAGAIGYGAAWRLAGRLASFRFDGGEGRP